jgi:hypothetical protein
MSNCTYEVLRKRVSEELNARTKEFGKTVEEIERHFRYLGLEKAVWHPEKIYTANIGGLETESYIGYSRIEGKWGLMIRTIERDHETRAFVSQRVFTIGSCGNVEIVVSALRKIPELMRQITSSVDRQLQALAESGDEYEVYRRPDFSFEA